MRTTNAAALTLAVALLAPAPARSDVPPLIEIEVGAQRRLGGSAPICDDPQVAWISADGAGVLHGVKEGTTTCGLFTGGGRQVFRIKVVPAKAKPGEKGNAPGGR